MSYLHLLIQGLGALSIVTLTHYVVAYLRSPLRNIPGPFIAKFTNLWRLWDHYNQTHIETQQELHQKYGKAVRIGPNTVSFSDPDLVKTIYSTRGTFTKSDYYSINDAVQPSGALLQNIFSTRSNAFHTQQVKPIQKLYSYNSAMELEPLMDDTIRALHSELEQRFMLGDNKEKTCDIAAWLSYFAYDFMGDMTFSKRLGFMEQGKDKDGVLKTAESIMRYFSVVGQIPVLDKLLGKNPYLPFIKFADFSVTAAFCVQRFMERMQNLDQYKEKKDFMNGFLTAKEEYPELVSDNEVIGYLILNILGGADTTAIVTKATVYHILRTPHAYYKLSQELHAASLSHPAPYSSLSSLPYLTACIKEGLRIHPVVGHILERVVPSPGLSITLSDGKTSAFLPPGTIVGINPWVLSRNEDIYGAETDKFVPERWLQWPDEASEVYEERMKRMQSVDMSFGVGKRGCLGRPLALVELYKVVAGLFGRYEVELQDKNKEWELHKQWFVWPHKVQVKMKARQTTDNDV